MRKDKRRGKRERYRKNRKERTKTSPIGTSLVVLKKETSLVIYKKPKSNRWRWILSICIIVIVGLITACLAIFADTKVMLSKLYDMTAFQIVSVILCIASFVMNASLVIVRQKRRNKKRDRHNPKVVIGNFEKRFRDHFWTFNFVSYISILFLCLDFTDFIFWSAVSTISIPTVFVLFWVLAKQELSYFFGMTPEATGIVIVANKRFLFARMTYKDKICAYQDPVNYHVQEIQKEGSLEDGYLVKRIGLLNYELKSLDEELAKITEGNSSEPKELKQTIETKELRGVVKEELNRTVKLNKRINEINHQRIQDGFSKVSAIHDPWDIVPDIGNINADVNMFWPVHLRGLHWIGIPPFKLLYSYRHVWTSPEQKYNEKTEKLERVKVTTAKPINFIKLEDDVYSLIVPSPETQDAIPVIIELEITINILNLYKPLFDVNKWLELVGSQVGAKVRKFIGTGKYLELIRSGKQERVIKKIESERLLSDRNLEYILTHILERYRVNIKRVQIAEILPATKEADDFIKASTVEFTEERIAAGNIKKAKGLKAIVDSGGAELEKWRLISDSKLTTLAGQGAIPTIPVNTKEGG